MAKQPDDEHVYTALEAALVEALQKLLKEMQAKPQRRK